MSTMKDAAAASVRITPFRQQRDSAAERESTPDALLREIAALKRHDPNGPRGYRTATYTVNVPRDLFERIDALLKDTHQPEARGL